MVVAADGENPAEPRRAGCVGVLEGVAGAVNARRLAIPDAKQAITFCAREQAKLLRAPDGRRAEIFVEAFPELDLILVEPLASGAKLLVIATQRRAAIA